MRVDHAGELGAINIYKAQLFVAKFFYKDIVLELEEMLSHENQHFEIFDSLLKKRATRSCYALWFWVSSGCILGFFTAILGRNAIWVCTNAIESTVLHHLEWQLKFLKEHDEETYNAVLSIRADEERHQSIGESLGKNSLIYKPIFGLVKSSTKIAIWLSTKL
nr:demethoxyubiquinone hydroxylase family protein [Agarilytica rhodophyticola]